MARSSLKSRARDILQETTFHSSPLPRHGLTSTGHNFTAGNGFVRGTKEPFQSSSVDAIETNDHDWVGLIVWFKVERFRISRDQRVTAFKPYWDANRIGFGAGMAGANDKNFIAHLQSRHPIVAGLFSAW
jgi:hypothetical protein